MQIGVQVQVFLRRQVFVEPETLRHVTDGLLDAGCICAAVEAQGGDAPRIGQQQTGAQAHQRGLASPVGPKEAGDGPGTHHEAHTRDCRNTDAPGAECFAHILQVEQRRIRVHDHDLQGCAGRAADRSCLGITTVTGIPSRSAPVGLQA